MGNYLGGWPNGVGDKLLSIVEVLACWCRIEVLVLKLMYVGPLL
jgi:hypothetical protein